MHFPWWDKAIHLLFCFRFEKVIVCAWIPMHRVTFSPTRIDTNSHHLVELSFGPFNRFQSSLGCLSSSGRLLALRSTWHELIIQCKRKWWKFSCYLQIECLMVLAPEHPKVSVRSANHLSFFLLMALLKKAAHLEYSTSKENIRIQEALPPPNEEQ